MTIGVALGVCLAAILITGSAVAIVDLVPFDNSQRIATSPPWLTQPYGDRDACWGCGLEPEEAAALCRSCAELKNVLNRRKENVGG